ncbi:unnamed protein product [Candidula unifasciata]|uniref:Uncharacterized protein n=1 Tax=Candidula unifasciata TaxID=100452 RepID=A0A8S3Z9S4_9EUPU|nr:unnamed protein product [Candidula unifasciata]
MADIKSDSMEADTYSQRVRQLSGSFLSFISEAGRIFTGRTADSHKAAVTEEAKLEGDAVDKFPIIVVNKATRSEPENVQISVEDKVGMMVIYEDSVAEDKSQSDLAEKSHSDLADKSHYDKASQLDTDLASQLPSDLANKLDSDLADKLPGHLAKKSRVLVAKLRSDEGDKAHSDVTGSSQAGSEPRNTKL